MKMNPISGRSKSFDLPKGKRHVNSEGAEIAPRSIRRKNRGRRRKKFYLSDCTDTELKKAEIYVNQEK